MAKPVLAIVRGLCIANKSAKGRPSYAKMKGLMVYIAFGGYAAHFGQKTEQRGSWIDHNGKTRPHEDTLQWAKAKVHRHGYEYAYSLLLSTRYGGLETDDFKQVLQQSSELSDMREWRMMVHEDTENQHVHAILLRQEKLSKKLYKEWQQKMQSELEQLQAQRHQERQIEMESTLEHAEVRSQGWEMYL